MKVLRMEAVFLYCRQNNVKDLRHTQKLTCDTSQLYFWYNFNAVGTICSDEGNFMGTVELRKFGRMFALYFKK